MSQRSMYRILMSYLERLPGAMQEKERSLRRENPAMRVFAAFVAGDDRDLLLDSSVAIKSVQDLLDHKHITTTQIYDKRRRSVRDSASHKVPV